MSSPERIAEVFVELADTLVAEFDVVDILQMLTERFVEVLEVDSVGLMLANPDGQLHAVASTLEAVHGLEILELQADEGPCLESFQSAAAMVNVDLLDADLRWPVFAPAAVAAGFRIVHALPLRDRVIGALNLFDSSPDRHMTAHDVRIGQAMADVATIGLLSERAVREGGVLAQQLQTALNSRIVIEQAKGVLAERAGVDVQTAFSMLRQHARSNGLPLAHVARTVIDGSVPVHTLMRGVT